MQSRIYICCNCSSELFTLAASKASIAGMSAICILITDHITVPEWPEQSLICVMKGWFPAQQSRNVEVIILILCILAGVFLDSSRVKQRWHHTFADHPNTSRGPVLNTRFYISFPPFYWWQPQIFSLCFISDLYKVLISGQISANIYIYHSAAYVPVYRLQAPQGQSSRSRTWIQMSWWLWGRWCQSVCHMLEGKKWDRNI